MTPFWSYKEMSIDDFMYFEVRANVLLFIPIGFLLPMNVKKWPLLCGIGFSLVIEITQFITHRGTCETDDVISNTIGFLIGYAIVMTLKWTIVMLSKLIKKWKL